MDTNATYSSHVTLRFQIQRDYSCTPVSNACACGQPVALLPAAAPGGSWGRALPLLSTSGPPTTTTAASQTMAPRGHRHDLQIWGKCLLPSPPPSETEWCLCFECILARCFSLVIEAHNRSEEDIKNQDVELSHSVGRMTFFSFHKSQYFLEDLRRSEILMKESLNTMF